MRSTPASNLDSLLVANEDEKRIDTKQYAKDIGQLMYAMIFTRLDITFTLGKLS